ncbi:Crp/Fnr family transcriptional regulator [Salegentibacter salegens]|uniref:cAMP-binding domain of CRP or a regulatory subunit of cAMP-dependent protein kinases n=1 Tax=Salegentibacter salegens TaxID=143223 RepID=A0A1M7IYH5_9FLAO|nr:Crp/Fnr family transcriptional regulator [Salegentibacter salegens]PRX49855.1 CRP-like cAMP-binding protein [Salegentibacter salegens]SHM45735.1 cAMP-binding domain of CRP or a regulatory subunit of cAMP-dependent protein kinases [Salegentibacter salegens]
MHKEILKHVTSKIELSDEEQREFVGVLSEKRISKKEFLIEAGQPVDCEYYVVKGCLKAFYLDEEGNKHIIQFAVEDWWISDFEAFFGNYPAQLYVEAIEDSVLLGIHRDTLETLYKRIPKFERFFRIKTTNAFVALRSRILSSLQKNNKERYLEFCKTYPEIEKRVPNYHIANYLGIKPESLSRLRKELF